MLSFSIFGFALKPKHFHGKILNFLSLPNSSTFSIAYKNIHTCIYFEYLLFICVVKPIDTTKKTEKGLNKP